MNNFFKKLEISIEDFDWSSIKGELVHEYKFTPNLSYYEIINYKEVCELLPKKILDIVPFELKFVEISGGQGILPAHVDYGITCSLNYYFQPSNSIVNFYNQKENTNVFTDDNILAHLFKYTDIEFADTFTAQLKDAYLLNVSRIHEVIHFSNEPRQFLQIQWRYHDFNQILEILNDSGTA